MRETLFPVMADCLPGGETTERHEPLPFPFKGLPPLSSCSAEVTIGRMLLHGARLYWFVEVDDHGSPLGKAPTIGGQEVLILSIGERFWLLHECSGHEADLRVCPSSEQVGFPCRLFDHPREPRLGCLFTTLEAAYTYIAENQDCVPPENALSQLERRLLDIGGQRLVRVPDPHVQKLLRRGEVFKEPAAFIAGAQGRCHSNVARMWARSPEKLSIVTGYALGSDGQWRAHSWLVRSQRTKRQRRLIDTTYKVVQAYFGVILTRDEAEAFARNHG